MTNVFFNQHSLTVEQFLRDYWQKQPLLLPRAFADFEPELDADDIAGLACDELAESRLITGRYPDHDWTVRYGPFSEADFAVLCVHECIEGATVGPGDYVFRAGALWPILGSGLCRAARARLDTPGAGRGETLPSPAPPACQIRLSAALADR